MEDNKELTPEEWEIEVKDRLNEFIDNFLSVSKECNMATKYFYSKKEVFETHTEYDKSKTNGVELKVVFNFVEELDLSSMNFT
jgi:hypothetical protein